MSACERHKLNPVAGYNACVGCEIEALHEIIDRLTRERDIWKAKARAGSAVIRKMRTAEQARQPCNP